MRVWSVIGVLGLCGACASVPDQNSTRQSTRLTSTSPSVVTPLRPVGGTGELLTPTERNSGQVPVEASPSNAAPVILTGPSTGPGISNEQDFEAVSAQRSRQRDQALIQQNRAQYKVVAPTGLPERPADGGLNVVTYALSTKNLPGVSIYMRKRFRWQKLPERPCAAYASADEAQLVFLQNGGPEKDKLGLDPDGDGFACAWSPTPFRAARDASQRNAGIIPLRRAAD